MIAEHLAADRVCSRLIGVVEGVSKFSALFFLTIFDYLSDNIRLRVKKCTAEDRTHDVGIEILFVTLVFKISEHSPSKSTFIWLHNILSLTNDTYILIR